MLSISDAATNEMMREIVAFAQEFPRPGVLSPENRQLLDDGLVMVGDQIAPAADLPARRAWLDRRPVDYQDRNDMAWDDTLHEHEENEFFMWTETPFSDPGWRVEILNQGMLIVQELAPQSMSVSRLPAQIILAINSGFDEDPEEGSDATVGVVKFTLLRPDHPMDQSAGVERFGNPAAVFTLPVGEIHPGP